MILITRSKAASSPTETTKKERDDVSVQVLVVEEQVDLLASKVDVCTGCILFACLSYYLEPNGSKNRVYW